MGKEEEGGRETEGGRRKKGEGEKRFALRERETMSCSLTAPVLSLPTPVPTEACGWMAAGVRATRMPELDSDALIRVGLPSPRRAGAHVARTVLRRSSRTRKSSIYAVLYSFKKLRPFER